MFFTTTVINSVSTITAESSDFVSAAAMNDVSNYQDSIELYYSKTKNNERSSVQDPITKCNDGNDNKIIITEDVADSVLLEIQSQQVIP